VALDVGSVQREQITAVAGDPNDMLRNGSRRSCARVRELRPLHGGKLASAGYPAPGGTLRLPIAASFAFLRQQGSLLISRDAYVRA